MKDKRPDTSLRAQSRVNWGRKQVDGIPTDEQLQTGALMRIADALENDGSVSITKTAVRFGFFELADGGTIELNMAHVVYAKFTNDNKYATVHLSSGDVITVITSWFEFNQQLTRL